MISGLSMTLIIHQYFTLYLSAIELGRGNGQTRNAAASGWPRPVDGGESDGHRRAGLTASRRFFFFDLPVAQWNFTTNADDVKGELSV